MNGTFLRLYMPLLTLFLVLFCFVLFCFVIIFQYYVCIMLVPFHVNNIHQSAVQIRFMGTHEVSSPRPKPPCTPNDFSVTLIA